LEHFARVGFGPCDRDLQDDRMERLHTGNMELEQAARYLEQAARHVAAHLARTREAPLAVRVSPETIREYLRYRYPFTKRVRVETLFSDVTDMLWRWTEHATNPRHFGLFRPGVDPVCVIADLLVAGYDPNLATWDFAPAANEIERHVLTFLMQRFGLDADAGAAHFTSGGQESNHTAVVAALSHRFPEVGAQGLRALAGEPVFYLSAEGHQSFDKVAHATGLGRRALRFVAVDDRLRMDLGALQTLIDGDQAQGRLPFLIVATAGTTSAGVIDPLSDVADIAERQGLWYHVDAAWGGAAIVSNRIRGTLAGIERADSITCDAHKWFSVPAGAGMFFCRHRAAVEAAFGTETAYVPDQAHDSRTYPFITSLQWSRRFMGLKLFMLLAACGERGLAARIEHQTAMGDLLRERLVANGFALLNETPLPVVCFTHPAIAGDYRAHHQIAMELGDRQLAWVSRTRLDGRVPALRACITHYETEARDIDVLVEGLRVAVRVLTTTAE
jgi:aromatic-L-amino-acid/L-tryptophan decarboxylase